LHFSVAQIWRIAPNAALQSAAIVLLGFMGILQARKSVWRNWTIIQKPGRFARKNSLDQGKP